MLVQFMLKNVLSFKDETILDMAAINAYKEHPMNLIECDDKEKFLKVAAIYGANASGKSNLHLGMRYFQEIIAKSFNNVKDGEETAIARYFCPFSFDDNKENSEFEMIQIRNGFEYKYGFEYNAECIVTEWLYRKSLKTNRTMTIFERTTESINLGAAVRKECDVYKEQIPEETLALSFFNKLKLKTDIFQETYEGVMDTLVVQTDFCEDVNILNNFLPDIIDDEKEKLLQFLSAIDTGIKDIKYEDNDKEIYFLTFHKGKNGKEYSLNLFNESEGTIKSILLFIYARAAIGGDGAMFVDELNVKLHPLLLKFIIDLFYNSDSKAQLIYTTHDTTLMDKKFFRRDQIWFVQKDEYGYSELSALSDFKVRSDASFEKDYLAGVYGGIPLLKEFKIEEKEKTMATYTIENEKLSVIIAAHGAELSSIYDKANDRELVWQADPAFWNRHAPVLFPNVGKYYGGHFTYNGKEYPMGQHGFARDTDFEQVAAGDDFVTYRLCADEESKKVYPFDFVLEITHRLNGNRLTVEWNVKNTDNKEMYFTIGGHPAFNVNVLPDTDFEDYSLVFKEGTDKLSYILLDTESGTAIADKVYGLELTENKYALKKDMFDKDALVFDNGQIEWAGLALPDGKPYIALESKGFPNFGIWSKPGAPYVCLEPWCGRCDNRGFEGELSEKPGIITLKTGEVFEKSYDIIVY